MPVLNIAVVALRHLWLLGGAATVLSTDVLFACMWAAYSFLVHFTEASA